MKPKTDWKSMKKGAKLKILLDQQIITQMVILKNIWKSSSFKMIIHLCQKKKTRAAWHSNIARSVFNDDNKYYPQVILEAWL